MTSIVVNSASQKIIVNPAPSEETQGVTVNPGLSSVSVVSAGPIGPTGHSGVNGGLKYTFNSSVSDSDPGSGKLKFNNVAMIDVTYIYLSDEDAAAIDQSEWYQTFDDSTSAIKAQLVIFDGSILSTTFRVVGAVTVASGYHKIPVEYISGPGFSDLSVVYLFTALVGDMGDTGLPGVDGTNGIDGSDGTDGIDGTDGGVKYNFSTTTTDADPGAGIIRFNHATPASATFMYIDNLDFHGNDMSSWYQIFDDSTTTTKGYIVLQRANANQVIFAVTGAVINGTGYWKVPISYVGGVYPADAALCYLFFLRSGDAGTNGTNGTNGDWSTAQSINAQTGTSYTLVAADAGKLVTLNNGGAITLYLPQDSDATIAVGVYIDGYQLGAGQVTIAAGSGATLRVSGLTAKTRAQYSRFSVQKVSANTWSLAGDLAGA